MYENSEGDIYGRINYLPVSLFSDKIKIGIIGGGKAALIKTRGFYDKGCTIEIISLEFLEEFNKFHGERIILKKEEYTKSFIGDKHIIVIAIDNKDTIKRIIKDCNEECKIFINSANSKDGMGVIPASRETESMTISINTKEGNPKAAVFAADYAKELLKELDTYISFTSKIRNNVTNLNKESKMELLDFINSDDYRYFYHKNKGLSVLKMFYDFNLS